MNASDSRQFRVPRLKASLAEPSFVVRRELGVAAHGGGRKRSTDGTSGTPASGAGRS